MDQSAEHHPVDAREFEILVQNLLYSLLVYEGHTPIAVHHRRRYAGKRSGHQHEVDLSYTTRSAGADVLVLVECKAYRRPVPVEDVLTLAERVDDIGAHKAILVSTNGFDPGAVKVAKGRGIALAIAKPHERRLDYEVRIIPDRHEVEAQGRTIGAMACFLDLDPAALGSRCREVWHTTMEYFSRNRNRIPQQPAIEMLDLVPVEGWMAFDVMQFGALLVAIGIELGAPTQAR
jgi:hypothetical protein